MTSSVLFRWSGLALIVSGVLIAVASLFHPLTEDPVAAASANWPPVHVLLGAGILIGLFGLMGLYARESDEAGILGLVGFVMGFSGAALFSGALLFIDGFITPYLASSPSTASLVDMSGPLFSGPILVAFMLTSVVFLVGFILFGIATWRAGVLPRWGGVAMIIAGPLLGLTPPLPVFALMVGSVILGIGFVWMGYALWTGETAEVARRDMGEAA